MATVLGAGPCQYSPRYLIGCLLQWAESHVYFSVHPDAKRKRVNKVYKRWHHTAQSLQFHRLSCHHHLLTLFILYPPFPSLSPLSLVPSFLLPPCRSSQTHWQSQLKHRTDKAHVAYVVWVVVHIQGKQRWTEGKLGGGADAVPRNKGCRSHVNSVVVAMGNQILSNVFSEGSSNWLVIFRFNMREWRCSLNQGRLAGLGFSQIFIPGQHVCNSLEWGQREDRELGVHLPVATGNHYTPLGKRHYRHSITQEQPTLCNIHHTLCNTHHTLCNTQFALQTRTQTVFAIHKTLTCTIQDRRVVCR